MKRARNVLGVAIVVAATACVPQKEAPSRSPAEIQIAQDVFARANAERTARGLPMLPWDPSLESVARAWAREMAATGYRHMEPSPQVSGYWWAGDLIHHLNPIDGSLAGQPTSGALFRDWMWSSGHRAFVVSPNIDAGAVGVYCAPDGHIWAVFMVGVVEYRGDVAPPANGGPSVQDSNDGMTCFRGHRGHNPRWPSAVAPR